MYIYVHICTLLVFNFFLYINLYTYLYMNQFEYLYMYVCIYYSYVCIFVHLYVFLFILMCTYKYIYEYAYKRMHECICIYIDYLLCVVRNMYIHMYTCVNYIYLSARPTLQRKNRLAQWDHRNSGFPQFSKIAKRYKIHQWGIQFFHHQSY